MVAPKKTHVFCNSVRIGRSRSSKVVDFGTNRKGVSDFLLITNSNFWSCLVPFLTYGDLLAEVCEFFLPRSHLAPSHRMNPFEFLFTFTAETRVPGNAGISIGEDYVILTCDLLTQRASV